MGKRHRFFEEQLMRISQDTKHESPAAILSEQDKTNSVGAEISTKFHTYLWKKRLVKQETSRQTKNKQQ